MLYSGNSERQGVKRRSLLTVSS